MLKQSIFLAAIALLLAAAPAYAYVSRPGDVLINEIAWMGMKGYSAREWMELKNASDAAVDLSGWTLRTADGKIDAALSGEIAPHGFYLLERTSDDTVPGVAADLIYKGVLNNGGEDAQLLDSGGAMVDEASFLSGWPAGDNNTKQTMERGGDGSWHTSAAAGGTPRAENDGTGAAGAAAPAAPTPPPAPTPSPSPSPKPYPLTPTPYPTGIIISELLPNPDGPAAESEWVELSNTGATAADLSGWLVQDTQGATKTYTIPHQTAIAASGCLLLRRPDTGITLNDSADGVRLLNPSQAVVDSVEYQKAPKGQSYALGKNGWQWSSTPTPGSGNIITQAAATALPELKKSDTTISAGIAAAALPVGAASDTGAPASQSPWFLVLAVGAAIILAGGAMLIIAYRKNHREYL